ncbi:MAG: glycosyltransferase [Bdellovibrionales bacterium]|nr:glycosyltransferase [Oligoflexia bacterium]
MKSKPLALIFSTVWPEPNSSAAGVRQLQCLGWLKACGYRVILACPSKLKEGMDFGVELLPLPLNQSWVRDELKRLNPELIIFDRFILEEQFGHFVYEACPKATVILETQDLHFVRRARDTVREKFLELQSLPPGFYHTDTALRETASLMRVDRGIVVSSFEAELLEVQFSLGPEHVEWIPFGYEEPSHQAAFSRGFSERDHFVWIGNFRHGPNIDGLRWFRQAIWPLIRKRIPLAQIKVYGAYPSQEVMEWNQPQSGFQVVGQARDLDQAFLSARVNLAPLRFGAGVKGKLLEGFRYGLPCVTTKVGSEGILPQAMNIGLFPGKVANGEASFTDACIELYENERVWNEGRELAASLMQSHYGSQPEAQFKKMIAKLKEKHALGLLPHWQSRVLRHELLNSHKYFSKWIEAKENKITPPGQK